MLQKIIENRLKLSSVKDRFYHLSKADVSNIKQFEDFVKRDWYKIDQYTQHLIAELLAGNSNGGGKNMHNFRNYINTILGFYEG